MSRGVSEVCWQRIHKKEQSAHVWRSIALQEAAW